MKLEVQTFNKDNNKCIYRWNSNSTPMIYKTLNHKLRNYNLKIWLVSRRIANKNRPPKTIIKMFMYNNVINITG